MPHLPELPRRTLLAALAAMSCAALGQSGDPIRLIVPFTPGTGIDLIARQVATPLAERMGRPVVVVNKAGASGNLGTADVVQAAPDGSTLLVTVNTLVMNRALYPKLGFDPVRDLEAITLTSWGQLLLVASKASGIRNAQEFLQRARSQPGRLNYGSPGAGTPHHLAMELVKSHNRLFIVHVPYRGTAPALTDLLAGTLDVMFLPIHVALQHVRSGSLKALAISSEQSHPLLPEVPPMRQSGLGDLRVDMWYGMLAPRGTPRATIERLNRELKAILDQPEVRSAFETQGMVPASSSPDAFAALIARDAQRWAEVIKAQGITAD